MPKKKQYREHHDLKRAKRILAGGRGVARDDSDDELGVDDLPWEYIHSSTNQEIIGANMGNFKCMLGDTVLLKAEGTKEAWVGLLCEFGDLENESGDASPCSEKAAYFMWFSTEREIRNTKKKRADCLPHELYITPSWDWNPLTTINGKATILSTQKFQAKFPSTKIPRTSLEYGKTFLCRRGCNTRTASYTEEFDWDSIYKSAEDVLSLVDFVKSGTWKSRKRKHTAEDEDWLHHDEAQSEDKHLLKTPVKKKKTLASAKSPFHDPTISPHKFLSPRQRKIIVRKPLEYSPLATRVLSPQYISSPFQKARNQLHVSSVPASLPCREEAFTTVYAHLEAAITEGVGSCIYISGTPGTGKTATVREVVNSLDAAVQAEELDDFIFVEINGMKVTEPQQAYVQLWQALRGETVSSSHALDLLDQEFSYPNPRRVPCVVLMDELDQLVTKNQSVMYNFFNWPSLRHSRLIVLAVANTMDLPERTLSNKISSRLGLIRIPFAGYTHTDLMRIIQSRLEDVSGNIVDPDAVQFASRKVAAVSGDARRALDICRRAVEIAEAEYVRNKKPSQDAFLEGKIANKEAGEECYRVTIATIKRAISEATSSPTQQALKTLSISSKLILAALIAQSKRTGLAESSLAEIIEQAKRLANHCEEAWVRSIVLPFSGLSSNFAPSQSFGNGWLPRPIGLGFGAEELIELGMITMEARRGDRVGRIRLNVSEDEVRSALKDDWQVGRLGFAA